MRATRGARGEIWVNSGAAEPRIAKLINSFEREIISEIRTNSIMSVVLLSLSLSPLFLSRAHTGAFIITISYLRSSEFSTIPPPFLLSLPLVSRRLIPSFDSPVFNFDEKTFRFLLSNFSRQNYTRSAKVFLTAFPFARSRDSFYSASPLSSCFYSSPRRRRGIATNA